MASDAHNALNLMGQTFGRLTVLNETAFRTNGGHILWECLCECGTRTRVVGSNLVSGNTQSCGCFHREISRKPNEQR